MPWCKGNGDARQYDDCWIQGQVRNALCNNNNWALDVNGEGVPIYDTIVTQTPAQSPVFGVIGLVARTQEQEDDEKKGGGSGAAAGGGGGGGNDRSKQIEEFLQDIADQAAKKFKVKDRVQGTKAHTYAANKIRDRQARGEFLELSIEKSYKSGDLANYGESGSVRLDVVVGDLKTPSAVYDFKFGGARLSNSRIGQIRKAAGLADDIIIRPIFGRAVPR